jgi:hypothetical protein
LGLLLFGLLLDRGILLLYLLLSLLLYGLVLLVYLLLGQLIDYLSFPRPCLLLGLIGLFPNLLFCLLLLLFGLLLNLLFCLLLSFLGLLLNRLLCLGLLFGNLLLRGLLLLVAKLVEVGLVVVGRLVEAHGDEHRTVGARSEPFAHHVVGLARLRVFGQCPVVGLAEVEGSYWSCEDQQHNEPYNQGWPGMGTNVGGPAGPTVGSLVVVQPHARQAQAVDREPIKPSIAGNSVVAAEAATTTTIAAV